MQPDRNFVVHIISIKYIFHEKVHIFIVKVTTITVEVIELRLRGECPRTIRLIHVQQQQHKKVEVNQKLMVVFFYFDIYLRNRICR